MTTLGVAVLNTAITVAAAGAVIGAAHAVLLNKQSKDILNSMLVGAVYGMTIGIFRAMGGRIAMMGSCIGFCVSSILCQSTGNKDFIQKTFFVGVCGGAVIAVFINAINKDGLI